MLWQVNNRGAVHDNRGFAAEAAMCERGVAYSVHVTCIPAVSARSIIGRGMRLLVHGTMRHDDRQRGQIHQFGAARTRIGGL